MSGNHESLQHLGEVVEEAEMALPVVDEEFRVREVLVEPKFRAPEGP